MPCPEKLTVGERMRIAYHIAREYEPYIDPKFDYGAQKPWSLGLVDEVAQKVGIYKTITDADRRAIITMAGKIYLQNVKSEKKKMPKEVGRV